MSRQRKINEETEWRASRLSASALASVQNPTYTNEQEPNYQEGRRKEIRENAKVGTRFVREVIQSAQQQEGKQAGRRNRYARQADPVAKYSEVTKSSRTGIVFHNLLFPCRW